MKMLEPRPSARLPFSSSSRRPGVGVHRLHRLLGHDHVEIVVRLGARRQHRRRGAARRRGDHLGAVAIELGALGERQRQHLDHDVRAGMVPALVAHRVDAAADPLADPPVADGGAQMLVARHDLLAVGDHLLGRDAGIDLQVAQRAVEAVDMLLQPERRALEGARHVEGAVAVLPAAVAERDHDLGFRHELAVEPGDALIAELLGH